MSWWVTQMPRWGATPSCEMAAAGWNECEVSSPRGNGQMAAATAAEGVELEQKPGDSQTCGSPVQADVVTRPTPANTNKNRLDHKGYYDAIRASHRISEQSWPRLPYPGTLTCGVL